MYTPPFRETGIEHVPRVGGKNASLGEMIRELTPLGVWVPKGFSVTADAYHCFLKFNELNAATAEMFANLKRDDVKDSNARARKIRNLIHSGSFPQGLQKELLESYRQLSAKSGLLNAHGTVRSSATAEDLPNASFAGQQETYLIVHGEAELLDLVKRAFASLYTTRAVGYREGVGFAHDQMTLSEECLMVYDETGHRIENYPTPEDNRRCCSVSKDDVLKLAHWALIIEDHYSAKRGADVPMDIESAKDSSTGELFIVQALRFCSTSVTPRSNAPARCSSKRRIKRGTRSVSAVKTPRTIRTSLRFWLSRASIRSTLHLTRYCGRLGACSTFWAVRAPKEVSDDVA